MGRKAILLCFLLMQSDDVCVRACVYVCACVFKFYLCFSQPSRRKFVDQTSSGAVCHLCAALSSWKQCSEDPSGGGDVQLVEGEGQGELVEGRMEGEGQGELVEGRMEGKDEESWWRGGWRVKDEESGGRSYCNCACLLIWPVAKRVNLRMPVFLSWGEGTTYTAELNQ